MKITPTRYYGIAGSFHGNRLNVCVLEKSGNRYPVKNPALSWNKPVSFPTVRDFIQTVMDVGKLQYKEGEAFGNLDYAVQALIGWPMGYRHPALKPLEQKFEDERYSPGADVVLENIKLNYYRNHQRSKSRISAVAIGIGIYSPSKNNNGVLSKREQDEAATLELLYRHAKAGSSFALKELCERGKRIAIRDCINFKRRVAKLGQPAESITFLNLDEPYYIYLDIPEVRKAMEEAAKAELEADFISIKLPTDSRSDFFFDVIAPTMEKEVVRVNQNRPLILTF